MCTFLSVLDYGDVVYMQASYTALKALDFIYHAPLSFFTRQNHLTHHCRLYNTLVWPLQLTERNIVIYKTTFGKLPSYLGSLLNRYVSKYKLQS